MVKIEYVIGWDNTTFPIPGNISRIASIIVNQGISNIVSKNIKANKLYLDIIIGGQESVIRLTNRKLRIFSFEIKIDISRTFRESVNIEGEKLGHDIVNKLEDAFNSILIESNF